VGVSQIDFAGGVFHRPDGGCAENVTQSGAG
jgi:hypothetical protein